jgi:glycosyltransferase involved in cell wall biosynthesis
MRILSVIPTLSPHAGSLIASILETSIALAQARHELLFITADPLNAPFLAGIPEPIRVHTLGAHTSSKSLEAAFVRSWGDFHPDVVFLQGTRAPFLQVAQHLAKSQNIPFYIFPHESLARAKQGALPWFSASKRLTEGAACVCYATEAEKSAAVTIRTPVRVVGRTVAPFTGSLEAAEASFQEHFPSLPRHLPYLVYAGDFAPQRGLDGLIKSLHAFPDLQLVMVGSLLGVNGAYANRLKAMGPSGRVLWTGELEEKLKWGALAGASAFIFPSAQPTFSTALVQALSVGVPAFASKRVLVSEELRRFGAGIVEDTVASNTSLLLRDFLFTTTGKLASMQEAAHKCYDACFSPQAVCAHMLDMLKGFQDL